VPAVSAPLSWDEVSSGDVRPVGPDEMLARIERHGDLLATLL
jgi:DNA primase